MKEKGYKQYRVKKFTVPNRKELCLAESPKYGKHQKQIVFVECHKKFEARFPSSRK